MATVTPTRTNLVAPDGSVELLTWTLTTANVDGAPFELTTHADIVWQAIGTWGGATLTIQGSNTTTDAEFMSLSNAAGGTAATFTTDGLKQTIEVPRYKRPKLTTAGVGATVVVTALVRRNTPHRP